MNLSPFSDMEFDDERAFEDFQLSHGLAHQKIAQVMFGNSNFYTTYPLFETPGQDRNWLLVHQAEHQSIFNLLGMTGLPDLATVDLKDEDQFDDWMQQHDDVHRRINAALGIV